MTERGRSARNQSGLTVASLLGGIRPPDIVRLALVALILGGIFFIYNFFGVTDIGYIPERATRSAFYWIYERWWSDLRDTWFAHSHLVPIVCLFLVWLDRRNLRILPRRISYLGLAVIAASLLAHWAGAKSEQTRLTILSLIGLGWGIPFFLCGWPTARRLLFPAVLLVFSLPLNFLDAATYPLRILAAAVSTGLLAGLGLDVSRIGSAIANRDIGFTIDLADTRSSIFAVTAIIFYTLVCAYLLRATLWIKAGLVAAAVPLLIFANIVRGVLIMICAAVLGPGAGQFLYHHVSGPVVVLLSFGVISAISILLHDRQSTPRTCDEMSSAPDRHRSPLWAYGVTLAMIISAALWIPRNLDVAFVNKAGVNLDLPKQVGTWSGRQLLFCHNIEDMSQFANPALSPGDPCPECGEPLFTMSRIERRLLPADTILIKRKYTNRVRQIYFTIVLSGEKRSSIHRPEVCLVGPNSEIDRSFIHAVNLEDFPDLDVKVLEMVHKRKLPDGTMGTWTTYYAYWFAGMDRETPYHIQRMMWMASDRLFRNLNYRWAYISITGLRRPEGTAYLREIDSFLRAAYPHLHVDED